jgi:glycosyltransferase involved in cell wall biosynthesis
MLEASTSDLTVLILTLNEERHIRRCIASVRGLAARVVVIDSGSTDRTREIAGSLGADVLVNPFISHAKQLNWGLAHAGISTRWVMKLDADEYATPELVAGLGEILQSAADDVNGFTLNLRRIFMGKWLRHGGLYPIKLLRVWRMGHGCCEERWMDEHVVVQGRLAHVEADFADHNLNSISWWTDKHNKYASREAVELLLRKRHKGKSNEQAAIGAQATAKRWIKQNVYARLPIGFRALLYFLYRYVARFGFLDGWQGFVFHFLQGWWYRMLVDVKVYEVESKMREANMTLEDAVQDVLEVKLA